MSDGGDVGTTLSGRNGRAGGVSSTSGSCLVDGEPHRVGSAGSDILSTTSPASSRPGSQTGMRGAPQSPLHATEGIGHSLGLEGTHDHTSTFDPQSGLLSVMDNSNWIG